MRIVSTIRGRLILVGTLAAAGLIALTLLNLLQMQASERHVASIHRANAVLKAHLVADDLRHRIRADVYALFMAKSEEAVERVRAELRSHVGALERNLELDPVSEDREVRVLYGESSALLEKYASVATEVDDALNGNRLGAVTLLAPLLTLYRESDAASARLTSALSAWAEQTRRDSEASLRFLNALGVLASLLLAAGSVAISLGVIRGLRISLSELEEQVARVGSGDLTVSAFAGRDDELGRLGRRLSWMTAAVRGSLERVGTAVRSVESASESIGSLAATVHSVTADQRSGAVEAAEAMHRIETGVGGIAEASRILRESAEESAASILELAGTCGELNEHASLLSQNVDESVGAIRQMATGVGQITDRTAHLARSTENAVASVTEVADAGEEVARASQLARGLAERVVQSAEQGQQRVGHTLAGMRTILENERATREVVQRLGERASGIGEIIDVIDGIAAETNLLALNAAIIAAQSGENGRAFSVVADQIKEMADRALRNTQKIRLLVGSVQHETVEAASAMERGFEVVEREVARSKEAGSALDEIGRAAGENGERIHEIAEAAQRQAALCEQTRDLMETVGQAAAEIRQATQEQERATRHLLESCERMGEVAKQVSRASDEQRTGTDHLAALAERVKQATQEIDNALREQREASGKAAELLELIRERTERSAEALGERVSELSAHSDALGAAFGAFRT